MECASVIETLLQRDGRLEIVYSMNLMVYT